MHGRKKKKTDACRLSDCTYGALHQTAQVLVEIAMHCFEELGVAFVLLGKFQTDLLEDRFRRYRLGPITTYLSDSCTQAKTSCACKARCHPTGTSPASHTNEDQKWEEFREGVGLQRAGWNVVVTAQAFPKLEVVLPVIGYVAGYAVHMALKKLKYDKCKDALTVNKTITVSPALPLYSLVK
ncbi:hypothetical protein HPB49_005527 [Dermacentor silvarum]|uniref:Uncharacterized protein n=1 Tax=Dermacentor silvarum TaxID=543639 RepID=A0ACB8DVC7_DERSI|nr:hypothetical protein HPB49_005527 [Dermacentor silvarum]